jgi:hypothetical protein
MPVTLPANAASYPDSKNLIRLVVNPFGSRHNKELKNRGKETPEEKTLLF